MQVIRSLCCSRGPVRYHPKSIVVSDRSDSTQHTASGLRTPRLAPESLTRGASVTQHRGLCGFVETALRPAKPHSGRWCHLGGIQGPAYCLKREAGTTNGAAWSWGWLSHSESCTAPSASRCCCLSGCSSPGCTCSSSLKAATPSALAHQQQQPDSAATRGQCAARSMMIQCSCHISQKMLGFYTPQVRALLATRLDWHQSKLVPRIQRASGAISCGPVFGSPLGLTLQQ